MALPLMRKVALVPRYWQLIGTSRMWPSLISNIKLSAEVSRSVGCVGAVQRALLVISSSHIGIGGPKKGNGKRAAVSTISDWLEKSGWNCPELGSFILRFANLSEPCNLGCQRKFSIWQGLMEISLHCTGITSSCFNESWGLRSWGRELRGERRRWRWVGRRHEYDHESPSREIWVWYLCALYWVVKLSGDKSNHRLAGPLFYYIYLYLARRTRI